MLAQSIAPAWFVLPISAIALVVVAGHWVALGKCDMPAPRRQLRSANGLVMLLSIPVLAYSFGIADTQEPRRFVLAWMLSAALLIVVLTLALLDLLYTVLLTTRERGRLREEFRIAREQALHNGKPDVQNPSDDAT